MNPVVAYCFVLLFLPVAGHLLSALKLIRFAMADA
jgi:hypothetical protein